VTNVGGEWYYSEYANGSGVATLGIEDAAPAVDPATVEEDRKGILDLFKR
jgi:penicillin-binding protein 1A